MKKHTLKQFLAFVVRKGKQLAITVTALTKELAERACKRLYNDYITII